MNYEYELILRFDDFDQPLVGFYITYYELTQFRTNMQHNYFIELPSNKERTQYYGFKPSSVKSYAYERVKP